MHRGGPRKNSLTAPLSFVVMPGLGPDTQGAFDRRRRAPTRNDCFSTNFLLYIAFLAIHQPDAPCIPTSLTVDSPLS